MYEEQYIDYASLAKETAEMAAALQTRTLVFCLCNNTPGSVLFYIACLNAGVVPALLPAGIGVERLTALLYAYHPACRTPMKCSAGWTWYRWS